MASASRIVTISETVTLSLSKAEAETLLAVTAYIGGFPGSRRAHMDSIKEALWNADVEALDDDVVIDQARSSGVHFNTEEGL